MKPWAFFKWRRMWLPQLLHQCDDRSVVDITSTVIVKRLISSCGMTTPSYSLIGLTLSTLSGWWFVLALSYTIWSSMTREVVATMTTITLSLPSLLQLSTTSHRLVSQLFFKGRRIWLLDWCFWMFNPTWSSICGTSSTSLMYISI
jgi:hypothetical protein